MTVESCTPQLLGVVYPHMQKLLRDTQPLPTIVKLMPDATFEEHMEASQTIWRLFDAVWVVAERLVKEEQVAKELLDSRLQEEIIPPLLR